MEGENFIPREIVEAELMPEPLPEPREVAIDGTKATPDNPIKINIDEDIRAMEKGARKLAEQQRIEKLEKEAGLIDLTDEPEEKLEEPLDSAA
ncbi:hypothetical protein KW782_03625 [Candidatus Parcubacteria bacterium]|nr:hypothetical protein [Candidatus Parcubacteria bacterium]